MSAEHRAPSGLPLAAERKEDHLRLAQRQQDEGPRRNDFDDVEFLHHALAGIDASLVDLTTRVGEWTWPVPLYINGMTGGTEHAGEVNRALARAAATTGVPMASGSVGIAIDDPSTAASFTVIREENPDGFVMANLGAGRPADHARAAVELLRADALQVHLNAVQETVMPEGTTDFSGWLPGLEATVKASPVPVIVKEVGFGLSRRTLRQLREIGVTVADVAGAGGTDFARIEAERRPEGHSDLIGFGQSAPACLLDAPEFGTLLASGGVRSPLDAVRALALGASAAGAAGPMLAAAQRGPEAAQERLSSWRGHVRELMAVLGAADVAALRGTDVLLRGRLGEFARLRGIDAGAYARRSETEDERTGRA